jgi:hypothetical protein
MFTYDDDDDDFDGEYEKGFWNPDGSFDFSAFKEALKSATLSELKSLLLEIEEDFSRVSDSKVIRILRLQWRLVRQEIRRRRAHRR